MPYVLGRSVLRFSPSVRPDGGKDVHYLCWVHLMSSLHNFRDKSILVRPSDAPRYRLVIERLVRAEFTDFGM